MANSLNFIRNSIKNWWLILLVGALFIAGAIYMFSNPEATYEALAVIFSILIIAIGVFQIVFAISNSDSMKGWGWTLVLGILSLMAGIILVSYPDVDAVAYALFVGLYFLFQSVGTIGSAFDLRDYGTKGWGWLLVLGILGMVISFFLIRRLDVAALTAVMLTGINLLILGIVFIIAAFEFRRIQRMPERVSKELQDQVEEVQNRVKEAVAEFQGRRDENSSDSDS